MIRAFTQIMEAFDEFKPFTPAIFVSKIGLTNFRPAIGLFKTRKSQIKNGLALWALRRWNQAKRLAAHHRSGNPRLFPRSCLFLLLLLVAHAPTKAFRL